MRQFTYQPENHARYETYEWDNVWWEQADVTGVPRVLYIGDSISCATRRVATAAAEGKIFFDGFGTSKAVDNPYFSESVRLFAQQQGEREVIIFNNGLHGWHLDDDTEYIQYYEQLVKFLLSEFGATPIVLILTTAIADEKRNARVIKRNNAVVKLAAAYNLSVVDLYSVVNEHRELLSPDGVHLIPEGYKLLASALLSHINGLIK